MSDLCEFKICMLIGWYVVTSCLNLSPNKICAWSGPPNHAQICPNLGGAKCGFRVDLTTYRVVNGA